MGPLVVVLELTLVGLILVLLNARDHRRSRAIAAVLSACPSAWRGSLALHVHAPLLSHRVTVTLDVGDCSAADAWSVLRTLADELPRDVALVVATDLDLGRAVAVSTRARTGGYRTASATPRGA
jgi:hypothetical protein